MADLINSAGIAMSPSLPLVYSCSGCSDAAQMANSLALRLAREGRAEMSCIAGVGGGVVPLLRVLDQERPILALDGCALRCVCACLAQVGVEPSRAINLGDFGIKKTKHFKVCPSEEARIWNEVVLPATATLSAALPA